MYTGYKEHCYQYKYGWALAVFLILLQGSSLDSNKKGVYVDLSSNGRTASARNGYGSVVGTVGYSSGLYQWRIKITKLRQSGFSYIAIGVTTLPLDYSNNYRYRSDGTMYAWFSNQDSAGLAFRQTRGTARISSWQPGDTLLLTLNCDQLELQLFLQRTSERKTINMHQSAKGVKLYLYLYFYDGDHRVDILEWWHHCVVISRWITVQL